MRAVHLQTVPPAILNPDSGGKNRQKYAEKVSKTRYEQKLITIKFNTNTVKIIKASHIFLSGQIVFSDVIPGPQYGRPPGSEFVGISVL